MSKQIHLGPPDTPAGNPISCASRRPDQVTGAVPGGRCKRGEMGDSAACQALLYSPPARPGFFTHTSRTHTTSDRTTHTPLVTPAQVVRSDLDKLIHLTTICLCDLHSEACRHLVQERETRSLIESTCNPGRTDRTDGPGTLGGRVHDGRWPESWRARPLGASGGV